MQLQFIYTHFIIFCSLHVLIEMNQMLLKMLNRNDLIKKCFEAYMNFKGICNQSVFLTTAEMRCAGLSMFVCKQPCVMHCICTRLHSQPHVGKYLHYDTL